MSSGTINQIHFTYLTFQKHKKTDSNFLCHRFSLNQSIFNYFIKSNILRQRTLLNNPSLGSSDSQIKKALPTT